MRTWTVMLFKETTTTIPKTMKVSQGHPQRRGGGCHDSLAAVFASSISLVFLERDVHMIREEEVEEETQGADHKVSARLQQQLQHHQVTVAPPSARINAAFPLQLVLRPLSRQSQQSSLNTNEAVYATLEGAVFTLQLRHSSSSASPPSFFPSLPPPTPTAGCRGQRAGPRGRPQ